MDFAMAPRRMFFLVSEIGIPSTITNAISAAGGNVSEPSFSFVAFVFLGVKEVRMWANVMQKEAAMRVKSSCHAQRFSFATSSAMNKAKKASIKNVATVRFMVVTVIAYLGEKGEEIFFGDLMG